MSVLVQKYYEGDTEKTPTETNAATQDVKFIFPEEKKDKLQDGGIKIRYSKNEKKNKTKNEFQVSKMVHPSRKLICTKTDLKWK